MIEQVAGATIAPPQPDSTPPELLEEGHPPPLDGGGSKDIMDHCNGTIDQAPITAYMGEIAPTPTPT